MATLDDDLLAGLAQLARLDLTGADRDGLRRDLERILGYVDRLASYDDLDVAPLRHPHLSGASVSPADLRADEAIAGLPRARLAELAPAWREGRVEVPRTVDQDG